MIDVFGHPAGPHPDGTRPYTGQSLEHSTGQVSTTNLSSPSADQLVGVESPFTGEGSPGSPWLQGYEDEHGLGHLDGVTAGVSTPTATAATTRGSPRTSTPRRPPSTAPRPPTGPAASPEASVRSPPSGSPASGRRLSREGGALALRTAHRSGSCTGEASAEDDAALWLPGALRRGGG
ncbi:hypothetical protein GCM10010140_60940 [Streptosporangium pseudovulgare]|uniref:Uncharacterized protein n=1 Tax=Streptosporangium pseudovulgare TaxID=35765 RepID=A0ABQ2RAM9_9ACTN|nr:hypothetical protein GCM10010140_60940 [Streptosporangium pseudovulgare]